MHPPDSWNRYNDLLCRVPALGLALDVSRMPFDDADRRRWAGTVGAAFEAMQELEDGAIANPDEGRMVGHYWLRAPQLAPTPEVTSAIENCVSEITSFAREVHRGTVKPPGADRFTQVLLVGIGGSALGPMLLSDALGDPRSDKMAMHCIDNTDPDGIARVLGSLEGRLPETLFVVASKSGTTAETSNGMKAAATACAATGIVFAHHAVAVTCPDSSLDRQARDERWLGRFPLWEWVGGRTSVLSAVGLLPAALQGLDIEALLEGAAACDEVTRGRDLMTNPGALLALMWLQATSGAGKHNMVVLPYKDRLLLLGRYLQQLIMESLGKGVDLRGEPTEQGITVYGNKGTTDQHAFVQQLREGRPDFFVTFVRVLHAGSDTVIVDAPHITAGDYLHAFLLGTREALFQSGRPSLTISVARADARGLGILIALFERAVGLYAAMVGVNAYNQPGVEAGKQAASSVLELQARVVGALSDEPQTAEQIASTIGRRDRAETVYWLLEHLAANGRARQVGDGRPRTVRFCSAG